VNPTGGHLSTVWVGDHPNVDAPGGANASPTIRVMATDTDHRSRRVVTIVLLGGVAVAFLALSWSSITAPFGDSDDGINGAVWGYDSRAFRELGPIESRFGGLRADGTKYANHPPLIVVESAVVETIGGEHPWATRAGAWVGALATIPLLFLLLREIVGDEVVAAASTVSALACHMLFVYGPMVDTMIIAFPLGVAVALLWYREWTGGRRANWAVIGALALVASLGGWQATFLVGLCGLAWLGRARRDRSGVLRALPYLAGALGATVLTLLWARWVYGSLSPLTEKLGRRSGESSGESIGAMIGFQLPWLGQLLGLGFVACIACAVSIRDKRFRPIAILSLASVVVYAFIFREGSGGHQYWNYWAMLPAAVGFAYVFGAVAKALRGRRQAARTTALVLAAAAVIIAAVNLVQINEAGDLIAAGLKPLELVQTADGLGRFPADQTDLPFVSEPNRADDWLRYNQLPAGNTLASADQLTTLAREHPDHLVLVLGECASPDPTGICDHLVAAQQAAGHPAPTLVRAGDLATQLP
jgi:hypothetical protein